MSLELDDLTEEQKKIVHDSEAARNFALRLMSIFKLSNKQEGINALQALWVHHRLRAAEITFMGMPMVLDVMNLVISGDIEVAYLALDNMTPDDGSQPFHWLTSARIDLLKSTIVDYLGL